MKQLLFVPESSTSAPYVGDKEGFGAVHMERSFKMVSKIKITAHQQIVRHWKYQWPLLLTWINFNPSMDK